MKLLAAGKPNTLVLLLGVVFTAVAMVLWNIALAGMQKSSGFVYNVYMGEADISAINVTKVLPVAKPILQFLGGALMSKNVSEDYVFNSLRDMSRTAALGPMMGLLTQTTDGMGTLRALASMQKEIGSDVENATKSLDILQKMLNRSSSKVDALNALGAVVAASAENKSAALNSTDLFMAADNATEALVALHTMVVLEGDERKQLRPFIQIFVNSSSIGNTTLAFRTLANNVAKMNADDVKNYLGRLSTDLTGRYNDSATVQQATGSVDSVPADSRDAAKALGELVRYSGTPEATLAALSSGVGFLTNTATRDAVSALPTLANSSNYATTVMGEFASLEPYTTPDVGAKAFLGLITLLKDAEKSVLIGDLSSLSSSSQAALNAFPYLLKLLQLSKEVMTALDRVQFLSKYGKENEAVMKPVMEILQYSVSSPTTITDEQIRGFTPQMLGRMDIAAKYRLSAISLCRRFLNGTVKACTNPRVVQDFDYRSTLYEDLQQSDLEPYLRALDIKAKDLYLEGRLQDKQAMYVPGIRGYFAFCVLASIFALFFFLSVVLTLTDAVTFRFSSWANRLLSLLVAGSSAISATVAMTILAIIKDGTAYDNYGVVYKSGPAHTAMIWVGFVLAALTVVLVWTTYYLGAKAQGVLNVEDGPTTTDGEYDGEKVNRPHSHPDL